MLISLLAVLREQGGLRATQEANELLEAGNYRALNSTEIEKVFPEEYEATPASRQQENPQSFPQPSIEKSPFILGEELKSSVARAKEGPKPAWPRMVVAVLRSFVDRWTILYSLKALLWFWIWLFA